MFFGDIGGGLTKDLARGIEQHIDAAEAGQDCVAEAVHGLAGADVAGVPHGLAAGRFDFRADLLDQRLAAAGGYDIGARRGKAGGQGAADSGGAANYYRHAAGQIHRVFRWHSAPLRLV